MDDVLNLPIPNTIADLRLIDLQSRLTAIAYAGKEKGCHYWYLRCDCDPDKIIRRRHGDVLRKLTQSCGCLNKEWQSKFGKRNASHRKTDTTEYRSWASIKNRCLNNNNKQWNNYGGRGINVCEGIKNSFSWFLEVIGNKPAVNLSVDRIDNSKGYDCGRCQDCISRKATCNIRWVDDFVQASNKRNNVFYTYNGKSLTLSAWERETGINALTIYTRIIELGWSVEKALTTPPRKVNDKRRKNVKSS